MKKINSTKSLLSIIPLFFLLFCTQEDSKLDNYEVDISRQTAKDLEVYDLKILNSVKMLRDCTDLTAIRKIPEKVLSLAFVLRPYSIGKLPSQAVKSELETVWELYKSCNDSGDSYRYSEAFSQLDGFITEFIRTNFEPTSENFYDLSAIKILDESGILTGKINQDFQTKMLNCQESESIVGDCEKFANIALTEYRTTNCLENTSQVDPNNPHVGLQQVFMYDGDDANIFFLMRGGLFSQVQIVTDNGQGLKNQTVTMQNGRLTNTPLCANCHASGPRVIRPIPGSINNKAFYKGLVKINDKISSRNYRKWTVKPLVQNQSLLGPLTGPLECKSCHSEYDIAPPGITGANQANTASIANLWMPLDYSYAQEMLALTEKIAVTDKLSKTDRENLDLQIVNKFKLSGKPVYGQEGCTPRVFGNGLKNTLNFAEEKDLISNSDRTRLESLVDEKVKLAEQSLANYFDIVPEDRLNWLAGNHLSNSTKVSILNDLADAMKPSEENGIVTP